VARSKLRLFSSKEYKKTGIMALEYAGAATPRPRGQAAERVVRRREESMREFVVDMTNASTFEEFVAAFNEGFCQHCNGDWHGRSWDAFHDYLSWPEEERFRLVFKGWHRCIGLQGEVREMIREILKDNSHVVVVFT
jgi:Barstar (barnase inhibitor)